MVEYLLRITPATARVPYKLLIANKCISLAGNFDGQGNAPVQYQAHQTMNRAQGFSLSHCTTQLVEYLIRIAPATARVPYKQARNTIKTNASHISCVCDRQQRQHYRCSIGDSIDEDLFGQSGCSSRVNVEMVGGLTLVEIRDFFCWSSISSRVNRMLTVGVATDARGRYLTMRRRRW